MAVEILKQLSPEDRVLGSLLTRFPSFQKLYGVLTDTYDDPNLVRRKVINEMTQSLVEPDRTVTRLRLGAEGEIQKTIVVGRRVGYHPSSVSRVVRRALSTLDRVHRGSPR